MQNSDIIKDKISQDADQLGGLYYTYEKNEKVIQAQMELIRQGELSPRMFEVYQKSSENQQKLLNNITEMQNKMRKYYIDTYLDLQQKDNFDESVAALENAKTSETKALESGKTSNSLSNENNQLNNTIKDLTNQVFGHLTVLYRVKNTGKTRISKWRCQCDCENKTLIDVFA